MHDSSFLRDSLLDDAGQLPDTDGNPQDIDLASLLGDDFSSTADEAYDDSWENLDDLLFTDIYESNLQPSNEDENKISKEVQNNNSNANPNLDLLAFVPDMAPHDHDILSAPATPYFTQAPLQPPQLRQQENTTHSYLRNQFRCSVSEPPDGAAQHYDVPSRIKQPVPTLHRSGLSLGLPTNHAKPGSLPNANYKRYHPYARRVQVPPQRAPLWPLRRAGPPTSVPLNFEQQFVGSRAYTPGSSPSMSDFYECSGGVAIANPIGYTAPAPWTPDLRIVSTLTVDELKAVIAESVKEALKDKNAVEHFLDANYQAPGAHLRRYERT